MATGVLPSAEAALFDRSERLWGAESQKRLRSGKIVLLGATPCGCEALKNLVLPGLGSFVIVDDKKVDLVDLGSNFFLEQQDAGKFRAEATAVILSELNPLCVGKADTRSVSAYVAELSAGTDSISGTVVVATSDVGRDDLIKASEAVSRRGGCLVHALTNGLFGVLRIQTPGYFVVSTMPGPDTRVIDLRPLQPFPELQAFIDRLNPEDATLSPEVHAHIPWFVVLNHAIRKWREVTGSSQDRPRTTAEWKKTKAIIEEYFTRVDPVSGARKMHDSFFEAQTWCSERVDLTKRNTPELRAVLNDPRAENPTCDLESTWFLAHALRAFRAKHGGQNPVAPKIPDFDATTEMYKELQVIFRHKAAHDAAELWAFAQDASAKVGGPQITQDEAAEFAAQSWEVNYVSAPTIADELRQAATPDHYSNGWSDDFKYLVAHRASLVYHEKRGYYPGFARNPDAADFASTETAVEEMAAIVQSLWPEAPIGDFKNRELAEWVRGGGCEIVTTASILGAVAGQECIKLLQRMRRPVVHTLLYNGIQAQFVTFGKA